MVKQVISKSNCNCLRKVPSKKYIYICIIIYIYMYIYTKNVKARKAAERYQDVPRYIRCIMMYLPCLQLRVFDAVDFIKLAWTILNLSEPIGCRDSYCRYCTLQSAESKSFLKDEQHPIPTCNDTSFQLHQLLVNVFCLSVARVEWIESNRVSILHNSPGWPRHCLSSLVLCLLWSSIVFLELFPQFTH